MTWLDRTAFAHLRQLDLSENQFVGTLPEVLPPQLHQLNLTSNNFTGGLPPAWAQHGAAPMLTTLSLSDNLLTGIALPTEQVFESCSLSACCVIALAE